MMKSKLNKMLVVPVFLVGLCSWVVANEGAVALPGQNEDDSAMVVPGDDEWDLDAEIVVDNGETSPIEHLQHLRKQRDIKNQHMREKKEDSDFSDAEHFLDKFPENQRNELLGMLKEVYKIDGIWGVLTPTRVAHFMGKLMAWSDIESYNVKPMAETFMKYTLIEPVTIVRNEYDNEQAYLKSRFIAMLLIFDSKDKDYSRLNKALVRIYNTAYKETIELKRELFGSEEAGKEISPEQVIESLEEIEYAKKYMKTFFHASRSGLYGATSSYCSKKCNQKSIDAYKKVIQGGIDQVVIDEVVKLLQ